MLYHPDRTERLAAIVDLLCTADDVTADLISTIHQAISEADDATQHRMKRLIKLIDAGAWFDATLAILEMELPRWKLRRLVYDEGQWHCALSLHREVPDWLDDTIESSHPDLSLAVLKAIVDVALTDFSASEGHETSASTGPRMRHLQPEASYLDSVCCDNFA